VRGRKGQNNYPILFEIGGGVHRHTPNLEEQEEKKKDYS